MKLISDVLQEDDLAVSLARALAAANKQAVQSGLDPAKSLVSITQHTADDALVWRINYSRRDFVGRRGGDLVSRSTQ